MTYQEAKNEIELTANETDTYRRNAEIDNKLRAWAVANLTPVEDGYVRKIISVDTVSGLVEYRDKAQAEIDAEAQAARQTDFIANGLVPVAVLFRILLRRNFGPLAETDRNVDEKTVEGYFATLTINQTITAQQASDGVFLKESFAKLAAWNGTGETWTIFENYGEIIP